MFDPDITLRRLPAGQGRPGTIRVDLMRDGESLSNCLIIPVTIRVGVATVRVDGIGEVGTTQEHRGRGYARRVLTAAIAQMAAGDGALSMLYGIPDFYLRFGYATAGPEYTLSIPLAAPTPPLPAGWQARPARQADLPAIARLYDRDTADAVGPVVRVPHGYPWTRLAGLQPTDLAADCRVVTDPQGGVAAYAWRDGAAWFTGHLGESHPESLVLAEVIARDTPAADAVLAACRAWTQEEAQRASRPLTAVTLAMRPEGPAAAAARHGAATFAQRYSADEDFMVHTLHPGRLLCSLAPELERRLRTALPGFHGSLVLATELGSVTLRVSPGRLDVDDGGPGVESAGANASDASNVVRLPQTTLARLTLGAFCPADLLARLDRPPNAAARELIEALFPPRYPHLSLPDRF